MYYTSVTLTRTFVFCVWDFGLGTLAWELLLGNFGCVWQPKDIIESTRTIPRRVGPGMTIRCTVKVGVSKRQYDVTMHTDKSKQNMLSKQQML